MPQQLGQTVESNFTKGLITEATALNFPENAATDADNATFSLVGEVFRRPGMDLELNAITPQRTRDNLAFNTYKWDNAGGDGSVQIVVQQVGHILYFYRSSTATDTSPLSTQLLASTLDLSAFAVAGGSFNDTVECQFTDGNGYLFVYHSDMEPVYCIYNAGTVTGNAITVKIRDFLGVIDNLSVNTRPSTLSDPHNYNLQNQGWTSGGAWASNSFTTNTLNATGLYTFTVDAGLAISPGDSMRIDITRSPYFPVTGCAAGIVSSYVGTTLIVNLNAITNDPTIKGVTQPTFGGFWTLSETNKGFIDTWFTAITNYPSNADVWWYFKNAAGAFDPATTIGNITLNTGPAPKGHFILDAFNQQRDIISGISTIDDITTGVRPRTGTWFQGRVWYAGVDASQAATATTQFYTWTENIYFSQIITDSSQFGNCYQTNDPTSETLFDILPTDGGVIQIQGCGPVYKLFPIQNGMLVFAANGVWFITGSQGIGFSAVDYTITKISSVQSISSNSFVNVLGLPYFWNEDGIYQVQPTQGGGLSVECITVQTILQFFSEIPVTCKKYVKGAYHPIDYVIQWTYRSTEPTTVTQRWQFDKILNYNTVNKAFYPYTISPDAGGTAYINGIVYVNYPGGVGVPQPTFKYPCTFNEFVGGVYGPQEFSWAELNNYDYLDWNALGGTDYTSYFVTGYKLRGKAIFKWQPQYIQMYSGANFGVTSYKIQGIWDYANNRNSNRWSAPQLVTNGVGHFDQSIRRHKIRGRGYSLQIKVSSVSGLPFDIQGWAAIDLINQGT